MSKTKLVAMILVVTAGLVAGCVRIPTVELDLPRFGIVVDVPRIQLLERFLPGFKGSGNVIAEERAVQGFSRLSLEGVGELYIVQGDDESLTVTADDNLLPYITTEVRDETLVLGFDDEIKRKGLLPSQSIRFDLVVKEITSLRLSGVGKIEAQDIEAESLEILITGAGAIRIDSLTADHVTVGISGLGQAMLAGQVTSQDVVISGGGMYLAENLRSEKAALTISGLGTSVVYAAEELEVRIAGGGSVEYHGDPRLTQQISGLASVKRAGAP